MTEEQMVLAFNEWMRRYIDEPEKFEAEFNSVLDFLSDQTDDKVPSYGEKCAAYLLKLHQEL